MITPHFPNHYNEPKERKGVTFRDHSLVPEAFDGLGIGGWYVKLMNPYEKDERILQAPRKQTVVANIR
jgi:hypothetical protein